MRLLYLNVFLLLALIRLTASLPHPPLLDSQSPIFSGSTAVFILTAFIPVVASMPPTSDHDLQYSSAQPHRLPTPGALPLPFPTYTPTLLQSSASSASVLPPVAPTEALQPRCGDGSCTGTFETVLQASTVTSTIEYITTVPCYITTYITDSETVTATVYSTEIIVSTLTEEGTVWVIQYQPTPLIESSVYYSTMEFIETLVTYWTTQKGSMYQTTSMGSLVQASGGAITDWVGSSTRWTPAITTTVASQSAWTQVSATGNSELGMTSTAEVGWVTDTLGTGTGLGSTNSNIGTVQWSSALSFIHDKQLILVVILTFCSVLMWEMSRVL